MVTGEVLISRRSRKTSDKTVKSPQLMRLLHLFLSHSLGPIGVFVGQIVAPGPYI